MTQTYDLPEGMDNQNVRNLRGRSIVYQNLNDRDAGQPTRLVQHHADSTGLALPHGIQNHGINNPVLDDPIYQLPPSFGQDSNNGFLDAGFDLTAPTGPNMMMLQNMLENPAPFQPAPTISSSAPLQHQQQPTAGRRLTGHYRARSSAVRGAGSSRGTAQRPPTFQGLTVDQLGFQLSTCFVGEEQRRRVAERIIEALEDPLHNPPLLPENTVEELEPKRVFPDYLRLSEDAPEAARRTAEEFNNAIAAESQRVDRERNNEAAKRSRRLKMENLTNAILQIVNDAMYKAWLRGQVIALGGDPDAFHRLGDALLQRFRRLILREREAAQDKRKRQRSRGETRKRSQVYKSRTRQKRELNERAARHCAEAVLAQQQQQQQQPDADSVSPASPEALQAIVQQHQAEANMFAQDLESEFVAVPHDPDWDFMNEFN